MLVAVADPTNVIASDDLRLALGLNVRLAVAAARRARALDRPHLPDARSRSTTVRATPKRDEAVDDTGDGVAATSAPAIKLVNSLIARAIDDGRLRHPLRAAGERSSSSAPASTASCASLTTIPKSMQAAVTSRLKVMGGLDIAERRAPQDGRVVDPGRRPADGPARAVLPTTYGEQVVLRILHGAPAALGLGELGMSPRPSGRSPRAIRQPVRRDHRRRPDGQRQDDDALRRARPAQRRRTASSMTIEDPVEYQMPGVSQIEVDPQERPHLRARAAHDPAQRPRRAARRRDPRRGDGADRDPGGD